MIDNNCVKCNTPLAFSLSDTEVTCSLCGHRTIISLKESVPKKNDAKPMKKKSLFMRFLDKILILVLLGYLLIQVLKFFGFEFNAFVENVEKVRITSNDIYNFSQEGVSELLTRYYAHLNSRQWISSAATRTRLNTNEITNCIKTNLYLDDKDSTAWVIEFICEVDGKRIKDGHIVTKELKSRFERFLKANK